MKPFRAFSVGLDLVDRALQDIEASFMSLQQAVTNAKLVRATLDNTRDWPVTHGLGYVPTSWEIVDKDAAADVWRSSAVNPRQSTVMLLRASAPVAVIVRFS
jgi:hypothetical protein